MAEQCHATRTARLKTRVTVVGGVINVILSILKIAFGILGQSAALIADGIHSLSDLASDLLVVVAIKFGAREADHDHPYGHRRYETMATVALGLGLVAIAGGIIWDMLEQLKQPEQLWVPQTNTLGIAALSVLSKEWLYHYTQRAARQTRSKLLQANAWHHRSDAISSLVVIVGIGGVLLGYPFADALAAVIVALMVAKIGLTLVTQSIKELVDTSLPENFVNDIRRTIKTTPGVRGIHLLRTRQMGEDAYIDAHIVVDARISVSEGHVIGDQVRHKLVSEFDDVVDVLVHVDPEDDEFTEQPVTAPSRPEVHCYLQEYLTDLFEDIEDFKIHYLDGKTEVEVILPHLMGTQPEQIEQVKQRCQRMENALQTITKISIFLKI
ncbi:MAG: cation transporter [Gammaproteobacteria bacterium HGW-Gammaproteobacteria-3]|nr:MAG: cation transporter [Gammaproteobacteria bacterium HGW-Gammaproteobacteria-3]